MQTIKENFNEQKMKVSSVIMHGHMVNIYFKINRLKRAGNQKHGAEK